MSKFIFESSEQFEQKGRGMVYVVKNPVECSDFSHLLGHEVEINGNKFKVLGVEIFTHSPPWRAGEVIGLLVGEI